MVQVAVTLILVSAFSAAAAAQAPLPVGKLEFSRPADLATLDMGQLKGEPARLAWSPDGSQFYLQSLEAFGRPDAAAFHYLFDVATGSRTSLAAEPEWAATYWVAKSNQVSPDIPGHKIALESEQKIERTTSVPRGGDLARGGSSTAMGTSAEDAAMAANNRQAIMIHRMKLQGETVGEFETFIVPGLTFGWGPEGTQVIAFAARGNGRVTVMDGTGRKQEVGGSKDALLPAWSPDASRLAWLQKDGRRKFVLRVVEVGQ
jgi:hypothetical protein